MEKSEIPGNPDGVSPHCFGLETAVQDTAFFSEDVG
jgi:hypothetical protein